MLHSYLRNAFLTLALCFLVGCTQQAHVPLQRVSVPLPAGQKPIPGHYAVFVQVGGWVLKSETRNLCDVWSFILNVDDAYEQAMKEALAKSLEKVTFVSEILSPDQVKKGGYNAQIVIHQGHANTSFHIVPKFFSASACGEVGLSTVVAITTSAGLVYQTSIEEKGEGNKKIGPCREAAEAIRQAAEASILKMVKTTVLYVKDGLNSQKN